MFETPGYMMYMLFIVILSIQCSGKPQPLRVYGGEDADQGAYPYVVRLEKRFTEKIAKGSLNYQQRHVCTASALSSTWAVTAAHCLTQRSYPKRFQTARYVIRYGSVHNSPNDKNTFVRVLLVIQHPLYVHRDSGTPLIVKNDIGLIKTNPMPLQRYIKLSPVDFNTLYGHEAVFGGFGVTTKNTSDSQTNTETTLALKKPLQIFNVLINKCRRFPGSRPLLCLGHRCGRITSTCKGDSGGPVIHATGIVAVLSMGVINVYCGLPTTNTIVDIAGSACPVGPYVEWIASYVRN